MRGLGKELDVFGELKAECLELRECSEELRGVQGKQWGQGSWTPTSAGQGRAEADLGRGMTLCVLCKQLRTGQDRTGLWGWAEVGHRGPEGGHCNHASVT